MLGSTPGIITAARLKRTLQCINGTQTTRRIVIELHPDQDQLMREGGLCTALNGLASPPKMPACTVAAGKDSLDEAVILQTVHVAVLLIVRLPTSSVALMCEVAEPPDTINRVSKAQVG